MLKLTTTYGQFEHNEKYVIIVSLTQHISGKQFWYEVSLQNNTELKIYVKIIHV